MQYKTFKIDCAIEERAKNLNMTVNEYIFHLTRLNDEHTSKHSEETYNTVCHLKKKIDYLIEGLNLAMDGLAEISEKLDDRN